MKKKQRFSNLLHKVGIVCGVEVTREIEQSYWDAIKEVDFDTVKTLLLDGLWCGAPFPTQETMNEWAVCYG